MKTNVKTKKEPVYTAGATKGSRVSKKEELRRTVLACLLGENVYYEDGDSVKQRIAKLVPEVDAEEVFSLAIEARKNGKLRHVPLFLAREMVRHESHKGYVGSLLPQIINRADELAEFLSLYWNGKKTPIANQVRKGLRQALRKFDEYSLSKWKNTGDISLRDVMFLTHPKPFNQKEKILWEKLANKKLETPDIWEVALSASKGEGKKENWERLLREKRLGIMALLRNLRNMQTVGVDDGLIREALKTVNPEKALPFRFISAAKYAPRFEAELEAAMFKNLQGKKVLKGKTVLVIDSSGSMAAEISSKSDLNRVEASAALAILAKELCEELVIYCTAGNDSTRIHDTRLIPSRSGFALRDLIRTAAHEQGGGGIFLKPVVDFVAEKEKTAKRLIIITDEQDTSGEKYNPQQTNAFGEFNYINNVSTERVGIGYNKFTHIHGFSESVFDFIAATENLQ